MEQKLQEFDPLLKNQGIDFYEHLFRPADYIETSLSNLSGHLLLGGLFVLIILYAFLFNVRTAFISALAIPVSLIGAIMLLLAFGVNLNIMVLGGLAIALGEVVDDAIIAPTSTSGLCGLYRVDGSTQFGGVCQFYCRVGVCTVVDLERGSRTLVCPVGLCVYFSDFGVVAGRAHTYACVVLCAAG